MKKHSFDITSFLFGIIFGAAAAGFLLAEGFSWDVDGRWVLPSALIILGVAGIAGAISGLRPANSSEDAEETPAEDPAASETTTGDPRDTAYDEVN
ncbi:MAG TPA: hypothetical protein VFX15_07670 [Actinomycetes bacterium]|nr:hypothetical protein [Actinomycetes bacterium]